MCLQSDTIKFCTCTRGSYKKLPHYWLLYRFWPGENDTHTVGSVMLPYENLTENDIQNQSILELRLNEYDAFDKAIQFQERDKLEVVINNLSEDESLTKKYHYIYEKKKWKTESFSDPFELMNDYKRVKRGLLKID